MYAYLSHYTHSPHTQSLSLDRLFGHDFVFIYYACDKSTSLSVGSAHTTLTLGKKILCERKKRTRTRIPLFSPPFTQTHAKFPAPLPALYMRRGRKFRSRIFPSENRTRASFYLHPRPLACKSDPRKKSIQTHTHSLTHTALVLDDSCLGL